LCRSTLKVNETLLQAQKNLRLIGSATSGICHIEQSACQERGIRILDAKGANAPSVCDYLLSVLAFCQQHFSHPIKTVGIIGVGSIGSLLAERLQYLGFEIMLNDPFRKDEQGFNHRSLNEIKQCDFISLHLPHTKTGKFPTHHLINHDFLQELRPGTVLVNTARGHCLDEQAMIANPHVAFCCDVFQQEPSVNPLVIKKALLATPHIAGHAIESKKRLLTLIQQKILNALGKPLSQGMRIKKSKNYSLTDALKHYDPSFESKALKKMPTRQGFLQLRANHTFRHELFH
jgi:erythronate-4-phosphate dehydrogenase